MTKDAEQEKHPVSPGQRRVGVMEAVNTPACQKWKVTRNKREGGAGNLGWN